jgi:hypothetical protein
MWTHPITGMINGPCPPVRHWYTVGRDSATTLAIPPTSLGYEKIESTTRAKPYFNAVRHERIQGFSYPFLSSVLYGQSTSNFAYRRIACPSTTTLSNLGVLEVVPWGAYEDVRRRAWWSMQPRFETEVQLLNFIFELKDFRSLAKHLMNFKISEVGVKMRSLRRRLQKGAVKSGTLGGTLADITRVAAEARLVNEFAIKPTLSDLANIFHLLAETITMAQSEFAARGALHQLSHYSEPEAPVTSGSYGTRYYTPRFLGVVAESQFTATMQYSYKYELRKGWDLLKVGLGLQFTAEAIWNMIPFSFLVDYVYKVGQAFRDMRVDPNVQMRLLQYCESIKQSRSIGYHYDTSNSNLLAFYCPTNKFGISHIPVTGYGWSLYRRRLVAPNKGAALPRYKTASNRQLLNLAALVRCFFN